MINKLIIPITLLLLAIAIWELAWKSFALYHSARNAQWEWFVPIILFNTLGILPIVYLFFFRKDKKLRTK